MVPPGNTDRGFSLRVVLVTPPLSCPSLPHSDALGHFWFLATRAFSRLAAPQAAGWVPCPTVAGGTESLKGTGTCLLLLFLHLSKSSFYSVCTAW